MSSSKNRARAIDPSSGQVQAALSPAASSPGAAEAPTVATFTLDDVSAAVRYWGDDPADRSRAKVSGGFGPNACLAIEVLAVMTLAGEQTVACPAASNLAMVVGRSLLANSGGPRAPLERASDAIA